MNIKPILIVAGEPNSVFLEIFFKCLKIKKFKSPLVIIVSKNLLVKQMKKLGFDYKINLLKKNYKELHKLNNKKINIINVDYVFKEPFEKISNKSNNYINTCFKLSIKILKKNKYLKFINGPISKKNFLSTKFLGITEYLAKQTRANNVAMLIYNKKL